MMLKVCANEAALLVGLGIRCCVAGPWRRRIVVVVTPFCEVVGELKAWCIGVGILKVNDYELLVLICGE